MIVIRNNILPPSGFVAINLFGILFVRKGYEMKIETYNHEAIHSAQMKEMLIIGFYLWYIIEWIVRLFQYGFSHRAYRNISFEREAYTNQNNLDYLSTRKRLSWINYLRK